MSATNATTNYSLPLFIGTDKPAWLVDWNGAMNSIDSVIKTVDTDVQANATAISGLSTTVSAHTTSISTITGQISTLSTGLNTAQGNINTINSLIGNGEPTTTDKTLIGAINEIYGMITGGGSTEIAAANVSYDGTTSGLVATSVQAAIDEVNGKISTPEADDIAYDNQTSGLVATNVQAAIDELAQGGGVDYQDVDVTVSNISGTTTVAADDVTSDITTAAPSGYVASFPLYIATAGMSTVASLALASDNKWYLSHVSSASATLTFTIKMRYVKS